MKSENVVVSVIIPSFNQGNFLLESVQSVLDQSFKYYEIIIIDDCSDDGYSVDVALSLESEKIRVIVNERNIGVCSTRNKAIEMAIGKYILPLDADDKIEKTYLEKAVGLIECEVADVIYCKARFFGTKSGEWFLPNFSRYTILFKNIVFNCALFKKEDWKIVGGYSGKFKNGYEDWDLWLSFIENKKTFYKIDEILFNYRKHENSRNSFAKIQHYKLVEEIFENHKELYSKYKIFSPPRRHDFKKKSRKKFILSLFFNQINKISNRFSIAAIKKKIIKLHYFNSPDCPNFGDVLNVPLIEHLSGKSVQYTDAKNADYLCIGSLLDIFLKKRERGYHVSRKLHVWGSGFIAPEGAHPVFGDSREELFSRDMVFHAVRGLVTLNRLRRMGFDVRDTAVGDPGLLASHVFPIKNVVKKFRVGLIPHYADVAEPIFHFLLKRLKNVTLINIFDPPEIFLAKISECDVVLSSAMHGIVAADSYGIPNIWLRISDNLTGGDYKFKDYYSVYSLAPRYLILSEALSLSDSDIDKIIEQYSIQQLKVRQIQLQLLNSCPWIQ